MFAFHLLHILFAQGVRVQMGSPVFSSGLRLAAGRDVLVARGAFVMAVSSLFCCFFLLAHFLYFTGHSSWCVFLTSFLYLVRIALFMLRVWVVGKTSVWSVLSSMFLSLSSYKVVCGF